MIDTNTQLKAGGRVKISGIWHDIANAPECNNRLCANIGTLFIPADSMIAVIEAYEPPVVKPDPFEWLTVHKLLSVNLADVNKFLTAEHGDPTIYTYASENADHFGLVRTSDVLLWQLNAIGGDAGRWSETEFRHLEEGDLWRRQPAAPKGVAS